MLSDTTSIISTEMSEQAASGAGGSYHALAPSGQAYSATMEPAAPALPFTDAQVDEYREQDRWLPVGLGFRGTVKRR